MLLLGLIPVFQVGPAGRFAPQQTHKMSSVDDLEAPWGQLVSVDDSGDGEVETIPTVGDKFTIGRGKGTYKP